MCCYNVDSISCLSALGYHENCLALVSERINKLQQHVNDEQRSEEEEEEEDTVKSDKGMKVADLFVLRARIRKQLGQVSRAIIRT